MPYNLITLCIKFERNQLSGPNFFVFFFFAALINSFKNNFSLLRISPTLYHQLAMLYNAYFSLKFGWISKNLSDLFMIVDKLFSKSFVTSSGKMGSAIKLKLFIGIHLLLKAFCFETFVNHSAGNNFVNKSTNRCDFLCKYFYRRLSVINSNVDFIINSIEYGR